MPLLLGWEEISDIRHALYRSLKSATKLNLKDEAEIFKTYMEKVDQLMFNHQKDPDDKLK